MMAKEKKKVPNLSFKGFTDDWEQRKLGEVADVKDGTHDSPRYINEGYPLLTSKNVGNGYINYDDVKYVSENDYVQINKRSKVDINDILMGMIGTIGNLALIREEPDFAIKNVALIKHTSNFDYQFLFQELQTSAISKELLSGMDGGTQKFVSLKKIRNLSVMLPSENEQKQIGAFFKQFDSLIALQQRKLDLLKQLKKGFLQKMFAEKNSKQPVLRFKGFHDDWEHRKLGDIALFSKGKGISKKDLQTHGIYNIVHYADVYKFMPVQDKVLHHSNNKMGVRIGSNSLLFAGSDVTPKGLARTTAIKQENVRVGGDVIIADLSEKHLNYFMSYEINMNKRFIYPFITGSTVRHIHGSDLSHLNITFPSLSEQKNIAHIFNLIEHELSLLKIKKSKYQSIKKSLLQQMFI
ncbi:restriction endonuclease subunit S [Limosilactobacillus reuteri]|uniref:restriction endonuclease subunit S n=1 Tax=Limosilactobacillus reuteri TaxID=1598 RepID=UPI003CFEBAD5